MPGAKTPTLQPIPTMPMLVGELFEFKKNMSWGGSVCTSSQNPVDFRHIPKWFGSIIEGEGKKKIKIKIY